METSIIGIGQVGEIRDLVSSKSGAIFRKTVKLLCPGYVLEVGFNPDSKPEMAMLDELAKQGGQMVAFRAGVAAGYKGGTDYHLRDFKPGFDVAGVLPPELVGKQAGKQVAA